MLNKDANICKKIIEHCNSVESDIKNKNKDEFINNKTYFQSVCFALLQIGENLGSISYEFIESYPKIPIRNIRGLRNRIVRGYGTIDPDMIWEIANNDIPVLKKQLTEALNNFINEKIA